MPKVRRVRFDPNHLSEAPLPDVEVRELEKRLAARKNIRTLAAPEGDTTTGLVLSTVTIERISIEMALELGYGKLFQGATSADTYAYLYEVMATETVVTDRDGVIADVYGAGFRVAMRSVAFEANAMLSVAGAAANATSSGNTLSIEVREFGLPKDAVKELASITALSADNMDQFGEALQSAVNSIMENLGEVDPQPVEVILAEPIPLTTRNIGISSAFALGRIENGASYDEAIEHLGKVRLQSATNPGLYGYTDKVDAILVRGIYNLLGIDGNDAPNEAQKDRAEAMLWSGWGRNFDDVGTTQPVVQAQALSPLSDDPPIVPIDWDNLVYIPSYTTPNGDVEALLPYGQVTPPTAPPFEAGSSTYRFSGRKTQVSVDAALELGFNEVVGTDSSVSSQYFLWNGMRAVAVADDTGGLVKEWVFGLGFQLCVKALTTSLDASANVASIAVQSTLGSASSTYQVLLRGIDLAGFPLLSSLMTTGTGPFSAATLDSIGAAHAELNSVLLSDDPQLLEPQLIGVVVNHHSTQLVNAVAQAEAACFALGAITKKGIANRAKTREQAVEQATARGLDIDAVTAIYEAVAPSGGTSEKPSSFESNEAYAMLYAGYK